MKKNILTSIITITLIFAFVISNAGEKDYLKKMETSVKELMSAESAEAVMKVAHDFEQIAAAEKDKWLPNYYVTYSYLDYIFSEKKDVDTDKLLDKAQAALDRARELSPGNAEIEVIQGWLYQGRIQADPAVRGMEYSQKAAASFGKAKNLDPGNPRVYFLSGMNVLYTPEQYGGGMDAACPYFMQAKEKYDSFEPASSISPDWGKEYTEKLIKNCNN